MALRAQRQQPNGLVQRDQLHVMLVCQMGCNALTGHQRNLFAHGVMHRKQCLQITRLRAHVIGQIGRQHGLQIDDILTQRLQIVFREHGLSFPDLYCLYNAVGFASVQINVQQTIFNGCGTDLDPLCQHKRALKLPTSDAAMQEYPLAVLFALAAAHDQR